MTDHGVLESSLNDLPVVSEEQEARNGDGQLEVDPVPDEVGHQGQEGSTDPEWELGQDTEGRSELWSADFSHCQKNCFSKIFQCLRMKMLWQNDSMKPFHVDAF